MIHHRPKPFIEEIRTGTSDSILASLLRTILMDIGITPMQFDRLLERYIVNAQMPYNVKEVSNQRGNLKKELLKSAMTWKVFIKGLVFLNIKRFNLTVTLHHANGSVTSHSKSVTLDTAIPDDDQEVTNETD